MKKNNLLRLAPALLLVACSSFNSNADTGYQLSQILTCEENTTPEGFVALINKQSGGWIISGSQGDSIDGEYTVSNPVIIWGYQVRNFSYHKGSNEDGDFTEYRAVIPATSNSINARSVASRGNIPQVAEGYFYRAVGNHDLLIRQFNDDVVISCARDVRTTTKKINRFMRELKDN
ncbi:hypothetical protein [Serratia symbiotica]|uniref:hypothetical protein n=1 Tax=Serratia symbiotica TaxID=138074 RepID=UPI00132C96C1|nr:hypothetical protein [Serratia symbiotica]QTP13375.1 hypothetical protein GPZ83_0000100 [Serratia symbiotica]